MKKLLLLVVVLVFAGCAPFLAGPVDPNSSLIIGRIVIENKFPGSFYGVLPQGTIETGIDVEVESHNGEQIYNVTTDDQGFFVVPNIQQANYYVRRIMFEGKSGNYRERRSQELRRPNFSPVPGQILYIGTVVVELSERGFANVKELREDDKAKFYLRQTYAKSPWVTRSLVAPRTSSIVSIAPAGEAKKLDTGSPTILRADKPEWKPGNQWKFAWKRPGSSGTATREVVREDKFENIPSFVVRVGKNENFYTKDALGLIGTVSSGKVITRRDSPYQPFSWPLEVGKEWKNSFITERPQDGSSQTFDHRIVISKVEEVVVAAGKYEAFKIEVYGVYSGTLVGEYWYSPQVKWFVKSRTYSRDGVREDELVSYKVN